MAILTTLLIALLVLVCLLMVLIILMQRPKQEGLGAAFGGGMTDSMFGAQTTDVLQKGTTWLAVIFFCTTISLAAIKTREYQAEADKGEGLISNDPAAVTPALPPMPDLTKGALDPNIPLPGAGDNSATAPAGAETSPAPTTTPGLELLPPPDAVDANKPAAPDKADSDSKKPAAADKKPAAATTTAPKVDAKPKADAKAKPAEATKPAAKTKPAPAPAAADKAAPTPAPAPKPTPAPAPAPATDSGQ